MSSLWILPVLVTVVGVAAVALALRALAETTQGLRRDLDAWRGIQPTMVVVRDDSALARRRADAIIARARSLGR